ncbi:aminopeptidase P family protein [Dichotomicrobium thermohalophilum]|uniref:Xaa-Pro aminopeptidase n=1 Tax=Dichotomicrobium thermohalophilum TaxID=933063 RepID=A0A397QBH7_9HYPH|nr:aminopeptidase P family protein [Dichotomicrobium thermohalophilum]RIA55571.1 Xaa-Pro aminopeptidase [Dichotomicrobium thermohalophilum]
MFQNFEDRGGPAAVAQRVTRLREVLAARGLDAWLTPHADTYQNEFQPPSEERLLWLTGFSGSWGLAVILPESAVLFVDGRYTLQAGQQTDRTVFEIIKVPDTKPDDWLAENLQKGQRLGYDPRLQTISGARKLREAAEQAGAELIAVPDNPIEALWTDRPAPPENPVTLHPLTFAGEAARDKIARVQEALKKAGDDAVLLSAPESVAWLLNIRGSDVAHTPIALCRALVSADGSVRLFIEPDRLGEDVRAELARIATVHPPDAMANELAAFAKAGKPTIRLDPNHASRWLADLVEASGAEISEATDPCVRLKAIKNKTEIDGARAAHLRDGVTVTRFLAWLDASAPGNGIDEISAAQQLEAFRAETGQLQDISFDTISGAGPNGAIVHYRVTHATNRPLEPGTLYLVDSGGQYRDGTTDITRTVAIGQPTEEMRRRFTLVLKGHIAIATARFPKGTRGVDIDGFARRALWAAGLDYDHGTGHGVGSFLGVHEGPASISKRGMIELEPGMILSNEPGYYREGEYGIRIENLVLVLPAEPVGGGDREMLRFETLTLAPIDRRLVVPQLLTEDERAWLDAYHAHVHARLAPHLRGEELAWLEQATQPFAG